MPDRIRWIAGLLAAFALLQAPAMAQTYPIRAVKLVVGFAPGGAADFVSRTFQELLSRELGQPIIVENRPGAGSSIAAEYVAKSAPDGYTLLIASPSSILVNPILSPKAGFDGKRDLAPVSRVTSSPLLVAAHAGIGVGSLHELIDYAKKNPGKLNFGTSGNGSAPHLAAVLFMRLAGVDMVHVPFKGGAPSVQALLAGDVQLSFATPPSVLPHVQTGQNPSGRLRALAVTSRERTPLVPGVPGMAEAGLPEYEISFWYGFFFPAGTPREIVKRMFDATAAVIVSPAIGKALAKEGTEASGCRSPEEFAAFIAQDAKLWARLVKDSGARAD
ncbi:MAG: tripartite tricarboxylate transporter substrate binding protein [Betaproteobacteria bacterium]|nr:tripartite tricarboxylate transporter substrate binding protein [Betaproteobacteria bacterium]